MGKVGSVVSGLVALAAMASVGCAAAPLAPTHVAQANAEEGSDEAAATGRATTLALGIGAAAEEGRADDAKPDEPAPLPTMCGAEATIKDAKLCLPQPAFAKKLCGGSYPEVALGLFGKGTPWTRIYLAGDVEAWNASGGRTYRAKLAFDEEVIVLGKHGAGAAGGIVMTGAQASYDILRWDGSCVSVMEGEITTRRPPAPKPADVQFSRLEESTRHALLASPKVKSTHQALFKACTTVSSPTEKKASAKADKAFSLAIVDAIRSGAALPSPARRP